MNVGATATVWMTNELDDTKLSPKPAFAHAAHTVPVDTVKGPLYSVHCVMSAPAAGSTVV